LSLTQPQPLPDRESDEPSEMGEAITAESERSALFYSALLLKLRPLWPWLVVALVAWVGWSEVRKVDLVQVKLLLETTPTSLTLLLLVFTGLNLALAGLYDATALGSLQRPPRFAARWSVGVVTFAWSNFLTLGPLAGPALRLWLYRPLGVEGKRSRSALSAILAAFTLGLLGWCAVVLVPLPAAAPQLAVRLLLGASAIAITAWLLRVLPRLPILPKSFRQWEGNALALATVAAVDWALAWAVFHLALFGLHGAIDADTSLRSFFIGQLVGLASFIPGGLGSADAYWIYSLGGVAGGHDRILASLILYRSVYYLLPWVFATLFLIGRLVRTGRMTRTLVRLSMASYAFLCGAVLLASAATPSLADRVTFLLRSVPLGVVEISHWASVLLGFMLLVISRGLRRGYRSSHRVALALFLAGALTTFLKGLDFEEALLALSAVAFLIIFRSDFKHAGRLQPPLEFMISVGLFAVVLFTAIGFGSFQVPGPEALAHFGPAAQEPRFLRGLIVLVLAASAGAFHYAQRARPHDHLPETDEIDLAVETSRRRARSTNPLLAATGDKALFWLPPRSDGPGGAPSTEGFIAYRTLGRFLIAYSDPVCPAGEERRLLAAFLSYAANQDRDVVLYQISAALLPVAHDFGFSFFKLGEEGIVDLQRFDLKGNKAKKWRNALNRVEKAGGSFEIVQGERLTALLPQLKQVSDAWLEKKKGVEKGFSIGRFDEVYLSRFPCAVVRDATGRVAGFANVLQGRSGEEISVDLMRYRPEAEEEGGLGDVIEYLFVKIMLLGKELGYTRFNLGMAPLSSVGELRWARSFERLAHLFFRHGEHWFNFQGLRRFKEKFEPAWEPRYMAYPKPWDWPAAVTSTAVLIAGGWPALVFTRRRTA
jgi:phosphatidylglycerol lysyltransferase